MIINNAMKYQSKLFSKAPYHNTAAKNVMFIKWFQNRKTNILWTLKGKTERLKKEITEPMTVLISGWIRVIVQKERRKKRKKKKNEKEKVGVLKRNSKETRE